MPASLASQAAAVKSAASLRPADLIRAGLAYSKSQAELLAQQIGDAAKTMDRIAGDERIRRTVEKSMSE